MSRIGKQIIIIPEQVAVKIEDGLFYAKGPKGELKEKIHPHVLIKQEGNQLSIAVKNPEDLKQRALWGLFQRLVSNAILGVSIGYEKKMELMGVGYRAEVKGEKLILNVGYSKPVEFILPQAVAAKAEKNIVILSSIDKQLLGETAAKIRKVRKPEPYKGHGIKYADEIIRRKAGKKTVGTK